MSRTLGMAGIVLLLTLVSGGVTRGASLTPRTSVANLTAFTLVPPKGIAVWMHPTAAPIKLIAGTGGRLKACEVGTTFSYYWRGGCRSFVDGRLTLPSSGGAMHVGFRILPASGRSLGLTHLRVQWHCVDHFFLMQRLRSNVRVDGPVIFDC